MQVAATKMAVRTEFTISPSTCNLSVRPSVGQTDQARIPSCDATVSPARAAGMAMSATTITKAKRRFRRDQYR